MQAFEILPEFILNFFEASFTEAYSSYSSFVPYFLAKTGCLSLIAIILPKILYFLNKIQNIKFYIFNNVAIFKKKRCLPLFGLSIDVFFACCFLFNTCKFDKELFFV